MFIIYKHTNTLNNKSYIGFTSKSVEKRFLEHIKESLHNVTTNRAFHMALLKYPLEVWKTEILYQTEIIEDAKLKEIEFIDLHNTHYSKGGYNMTIGGDGFVGGSHTSESKIKTSIKLRKPKSYKNGKKGKPLSSDHISKLKKPRPHYKRITAEQFIFIKENVDKRSYTELAEILETDIKTIKRWESREKFSNKSRDSKNLRSLSKSQYDYIQLNKNNLTLKEISENLSLNYDIVKKWSKLPW